MQSRPSDACAKTLDPVALTCIQSIRCLDLAQGPQVARQLLSSIDSTPEKLFACAKKMKLLHTMAIAHELAPEASAGIELFRTYMRLARAVCDIQRECWAEIASSLHRQGLSYLVLKGMYFLSQLYDNSLHYLVSDVDVLVRRDDLAKARSVVRDLGYSQTIANQDGALLTIPHKVVSTYEASNYELLPYTCVIEAFQLNEYIPFIETHLPKHKPLIVHSGNVYLTMELDVHHNVEHDIDVEEIWSSAQECQIGGQPAASLSDEVYAWWIPRRFYFETILHKKHNCKLLSDLAQLVLRGRIEEGRLLQNASRYALECPVYRVYRFLRDEAGLAFSDETLKRLDRKRRRRVTETKGREGRDWGDFIPVVARMSD